MNCTELDHFLTPYLDAELVDEASLSIERHLESCSLCSSRVLVLRHNLTAVQRAAREGTPAVPHGLQERIFQEIRRDATVMDRRRIATFLLASAGVVSVMVIAHMQYRTWKSRQYEYDAARSHARQFPLEVSMPQAGGLGQWFGGKLDHHVLVPTFRNSAAVGARLLQVREKPAAYIRYDAPHPLGLFVFNDADRDTDIGTEPTIGAELGYNVMSWREGDVVYQLVSDLPPESLRKLRIRDPEQGQDSTPTFDAWTTGSALQAQPASIVR